MNIFRVLDSHARDCEILPFKIYFLIKIRETFLSAKFSAALQGCSRARVCDCPNPGAAPCTCACGTSPGSPGPIPQAFDSKYLTSANYLTANPATAAASRTSINLIDQDFVCVSVKPKRSKAQPKPFLCFMLNSLLFCGATHVGIKVN